MKQETQVDPVGEQLKQAVMQAAFNVGQESQGPTEKASGNGEKQAEGAPKGGVSPVNGVRTPAGRPKGVRNKLTNLRDAVLEAFDTVGGPEYLVRLANGTQSDRAAFISVVNKVLPSQINANVEGGIQVQLSWLANRSIGTTQAQVVEERTEVIDLERDSGGKYRIKDPTDTPTPAAEGQEGAKDV